MGRGDGAKAGIPGEDDAVDGDKGVAAGIFGVLVLDGGLAILCSSKSRLSGGTLDSKSGTPPKLGGEDVFMTVAGPGEEGEGLEVRKTPKGSFSMYGSVRGQEDRKDSVPSLTEN